MSKAQNLDQECPCGFAGCTCGADCLCGDGGGACGCGCE
jgi:hypothetical protein